MRRRLERDRDDDRRRRGVPPSLILRELEYVLSLLVSCLDRVESGRCGRGGCALGSGVEFRDEDESAVEVLRRLGSGYASWSISR